jgi:hypothetical protein
VNNNLPVTPLDERTQEMAGHMDALRFMVSALVKTHPNKAALRAALEEIHKTAAPGILALAPKRQASFDTAYVELSSHMQQS